MSNSNDANKHEQELRSFLEGTNTKRLSSTLRRIILDYIGENKDYLPIDFNLQLSDINMLFDFLEKITK